MASRVLIYATLILITFVFVSCAVSEISWSTKEKNADSLRFIVGLPSVAVGNLSPAARNPGTEVLCTGLYDVPGGYCNYFSMGIPFINFPMATNFTVIEDGK
jgi:hypothetical protein